MVGLNQPNRLVYHSDCIVPEFPFSGAEAEAEAEAAAESEADADADAEVDVDAEAEAEAEAAAEATAEAETVEGFGGVEGLVLLQATGIGGCSAF